MKFPTLSQVEAALRKVGVKGKLELMAVEDLDKKTYNTAGRFFDAVIALYEDTGEPDRDQSQRGGRGTE
jgi:hypothetical protein